MVIQVVHVSIRPEQREKWADLIQVNAAQTRSEEGCESYHVGEDIERPNNFIIVEQWSSVEAQYDHFRTRAFGELMGALGAIIAGPPEVAIHAVESTLALDEALKAAGVR